MISKVLPLLVRKLAEGDFGAVPAKAYWWMAGKKSWTGVVLGAVAYGLEQASAGGLCASCTGYVTALYAVAGVLLAAGLYDGALRQPAPNKPEEPAG